MGSSSGGRRCVAPLAPTWSAGGARRPRSARTAAAELYGPAAGDVSATSSAITSTGDSDRPRTRGPALVAGTGTGRWEVAAEAPLDARWLQSGVRPGKTARGQGKIGEVCSAGSASGGTPAAESVIGPVPDFLRRPRAEPVASSVIRRKPALRSDLRPPTRGSQAPSSQGSPCPKRRPGPHQSTRPAGLERAPQVVLELLGVGPAFVGQQVGAVVEGRVRGGAPARP